MPRRKRPSTRGASPAPRLAPVWAYGYAIDPPQPESRLAAIRSLLEREQTTAKDAARTWEGRLVLEPNVTHILVVSDSPEQILEANQRLEEALRALSVGFLVTAPLEVERVATRPPVNPTHD